MTEQMMQFGYLDTTMTSSKNLSNEVRRQMQKGLRIAGGLKEVLCMSKKSKTRVYKTIVRPILEELRNEQKLRAQIK